MHRLWKLTFDSCENDSRSQIWNLKASPTKKMRSHDGNISDQRCFNRSNFGITSFDRSSSPSTIVRRRCKRSLNLISNLGHSDRPYGVWVWADLEYWSPTPTNTHKEIPLNLDTWPTQIWVVREEVRSEAYLYRSHQVRLAPVISSY